MNTVIDTLEQDPPAREVLAGEYVLGVLDADERRFAEQLAASDAAFAAELAFWEVRLAPMAAEIAAVAVPEYVWARIRSELDLAAPPQAALPPASAPSFWARATPWRWLTLGGFATAAVAVLALVQTVNTAPPATPSPVVAQQPATPTVPVPVPAKPVVSMLAADDGNAGFVAAVDASNGHMTITPVHAVADANGRVPELWLIPADGTPRSLGVIDPETTHAGTMPDDLVAMIDDKAIFAVTLEPEGGGPGGKPSGPIIAKGSVAFL